MLVGRGHRDVLASRRPERHRSGGIVSRTAPWQVSHATNPAKDVSRVGPPRIRREGGGTEVGSVDGPSRKPLTKNRSGPRTDSVRRGGSVGLPHAALGQRVSNRPAGARLADTSSGLASTGLRELTRSRRIEFRTAAVRSLGTVKERRLRLLSARYRRASPGRDAWGLRATVGYRL